MEVTLHISKVLLFVTSKRISNVGIVVLCSVVLTGAVGVVDRESGVVDDVDIDGVDEEKGDKECNEDDGGRNIKDVVVSSLYRASVDAKYSGFGSWLEDGDGIIAADDKLSFSEKINERAHCNSFYLNGNSSSSRL